MKNSKIVLLIISIFILNGCVSVPVDIRSEYAAMELDGVIIQEKSHTTGFWLGFLPGGGSLYHGNYLGGAVGILTWPFSIIWETNIGWDTATYTNYRVTKDYLESQKVIEIEKIDIDFNQNNISAEEYLVFKDRIINKYDYK